MPPQVQSGYVDLGYDKDGKQIVVCWPNVIFLEISPFVEIGQLGVDEVSGDQVVITFAAGPKLTITDPDMTARFLETIGLRKRESNIIFPDTALGIKPM